MTSSSPEQRVDLRFLLGPAGSGKTYRCLAEARAELERDPAGPPLLFVAPKQATFQIERQLLEDPGLPGYTRLQVLSFERLGWYLLEECAGTRRELLDEQGRVMVLRAILEAEAAGLETYHAAARLPGFARQLSEVLREFQQQQIAADHLRRLAARPELGSALGKRLRDLARLFDRYRHWLADHGLEDAHRLLDLALGVLRGAALGDAAGTSRTNERGNGCVPLRLGWVWVDGFAELTAQESELLVDVVVRSARATLAFCLPSFPGEDMPPLSPWSTVARTFRDLYRRLAAQPGVKAAVEVLPAAGQPTRYAASPALEHVAAHWTSPEPRWDDRGTSAIGLVCCASPEAEAVLAAREIRAYVRGGAGRRYRDTTVIARSLEAYADVVRRVFRRYEIPLFVDRREPVAHHPLAELVRYGLRTVALGWAHDDWFGALKTGLALARDDEIDELENEALARGWTGDRWLRPLILGDRPTQEKRLEELRQRLVPPFAALQSGLAACQFRPDGATLAGALGRLWSDLWVEKTLEIWSTRGAAGERWPPALHRTVWEQMNAWLESLALAFARVPLPVGGWLPIIESGLSQLSVGVIPPALDQVLLGAIDRSRNPEVQLALVLGLNETVFPLVPRVQGLLAQTDRDELEALGLVLSPGHRARLGRERYYGYIACTRARQRLVLTWSERDRDDRLLGRSPFVEVLLRLFPRLSVESFDGVQDWRQIDHACEMLAPVVREYSRGDRDVARTCAERLPALETLRPRLEALGRYAPDARLGPELAVALYGPVLRASVSHLEQFAACPFKFFLGAGLRARERRRFELDHREQGSFQHAVLAAFHESVRAEGRQWRDLTPAEARVRVLEIGEELMPLFHDGILLPDASRRFEAQRLTLLLADFLEVAVGWMPHYGLDPARVELGFGQTNDPLGAWEIDLGDGHRLAVSGKVDRVDLEAAPAAGAGRFAVIDYKAGLRRIDNVLLEHGIQLQLPAYLAMLEEHPDAAAALGHSSRVPVGVFYVGLRGVYAGAENRTDALETAGEARRLAYRHTGRFNRDHLKLLDRRPDAVTGEQFNYRLTRSGQLHKACREPLSAEDFQRLLRRVKGRLVEAGRRILSGEAAVDPYRRGAETACDTCDARAVCRIDPWTHRYRELEAAKRPGCPGASG